MKLTKKLGRMAAMVLALALLVCTAAVPAMAANPATTTTSVTIKKTVDMTGAEGAGVPKATYTFTAAALNPTTITNYKSNAKEGVLAAITTNPIQAVFDGTSSSANINITFNTTQFTGAGIYYYTLKETDPKIAGMSYDSNTYVLKVYVGNNGNALEVKGQVCSIRLTTLPLVQMIKSTAL